MNKNSLIAIGLVGIAGIILYQVLFNFILPIALFVVLLYILKLLIKGFDQSETITTSDVLKKKPNDSYVKNAVPISSEEIKPDLESKSEEEVKPDLESESDAEAKPE